MDFTSDCLKRIDVLFRKASGELTASRDRSVSPEAKSLLITLNKLNRSIKSVDLPLVNPVASSPFLEELIKYFEGFLKDFAGSQQSFYDQVTKEIIIVFQSRVEHFLESFDTVIYFDKNDLFSLPSDHERWEKLRSFVKIHRFENPKEIEDDNSYVMRQLVIGQCSFADAYSKSGTISKATFGASVLYYSLFHSSAQRKAELFHARPEIGLMKMVYNMAETNLIGALSTFVFPYISVNERFFIPRTASHFLEPFEYNKTDPEIQYSPGDNVNVRLLSNDRGFYDALIIHVHGGGFISMSSRSHQCYTRKWVRSLDIPCLSIDYRLSPEFPFPNALDDLWQVYCWVLKHAESKLDIRPDKIFLVGDSAGGNLVMSLACRIAEENLKAPCGVFLAYPALNLNEKQYSPSMLRSFEDKIVSISFLRLCSRAYVPPEFSHDNYYINPVLAPLSVLQRLPSVRIAGGNVDPLHDENWRLTEKLIEAGVDVEFCVFEGLIHGALSLCFKGGMRGSQAMVDKIENWIRDLLCQGEF